VLFADPDAPRRIREELSVVQADDRSPAIHERLLEFRAKAVA
jgi:hypothetical protein